MHTPLHGSTCGLSHAAGPGFTAQVAPGGEDWLAWLLMQQQGLPGAWTVADKCGFLELHVV